MKPVHTHTHTHTHPHIFKNGCGIHEKIHTNLVFVCFLDTCGKQVIENHGKGEKLHHVKANHFAEPPVKGIDFINLDVFLFSDYINDI